MDNDQKGAQNRMSGLEFPVHRQGRSNVPELDVGWLADMIWTRLLTAWPSLTLLRCSSAKCFPLGSFRIDARVRVVWLSPGWRSLASMLQNATEKVTCRICGALANR